jgi:tetratricopeptide (TPR) repeat protein
MDDLASLDLKLLYPLLDTATTLDPQFLAVYEYGGVVLPAINDEDAVKLLKKGIEKNPEAWRLYHHLGYIYWQRKDYKTASETYAEGARIKGAPVWMQAMSARMLAEGGSSATAREMYNRIKEQSDDADIRRMAELRLKQIDSFEERDAIRRVLADYSAQKGRCPSNWREIAPALQGAGLTLNSEGAPLDPANMPYVLVQKGCDVDLDPTSSVPYK